MRTSGFSRGFRSTSPLHNRKIIAAALILLIALSFGVAQGEITDAVPTPEAIPAPFNVTTTTVTGTVVGPDGEPVEGAPVQALTYGKDWNPIRLTETTDHRGYFQFYSLEPEGKWYFSVNDPRYAQEWERERKVFLPKPVQEGPLSIQLQKPETLWGIVVDEQDQPVQGVKVTMNLEWLGDSPDPVQESEQYDLRVAESDADGRISLIGLRPGRVGLVLEHEDFSHTRVRPLASNGTHRLVIQSGLTLSGTVTSDSKPIEGVKVCVTSPGVGLRHYGKQCRFVTTDVQGKFQMDKISDLLKNGEAEDITVVVRLMDNKWTSSGYMVYQRAAGSLPEIRVEAVPWPETKDKNLPKWVDVGKAEPASSGE